MGIHLDWEIQAEQSLVQNAGEDPSSARARRRARLRLLIVISVLLVLVSAGVIAVSLRLREVDVQIEQLLRDTVEAEVAALRIGDYRAFESIQRSASNDWFLSQRMLYDRYQAMKVDRDVQLTGRALNVQISKERGRVMVEEIIDGIPYTRVWFYWRYEDGWHHVPPDYTFWGDLSEYVGDNVRVSYRTVDNDLAVSMGLRIQDWLHIACSAIVCGELPEISVNIVPHPGLEMAWSDASPWTLNVPSPYTDRARSDMPFDLDMQLEVASLIAERMVSVGSDNLRPIYPTDSWYLRQAVINWLVGRFARINTNSFLVESLARNYGDQAVGLLLQFMQPDSNVDVLNVVTGVNSLDKTSLDWRDLLTWRLVTEDDLIAQGDLQGFLSLYDTNDAAVQSAALLRFDAKVQLGAKVVVFVLPETTAEGIPLLRATMQFGRGDQARQEEVLFRLMNQVWRRAS